MNNFDKRDDCPGDDHPVIPKPKEINSELSPAEKWMVVGCIAVLIIMAVVMVIYV